MTTPESSQIISPFHAGERAVQSRAGVDTRVEEIGRRMFRDTMTPQLRQFFPLLPFVAVAANDTEGRLQATLLAGAHPGFVSASNETTLEIDALPPPHDPLAGALRPGASLGLLGIELQTRRRNRANGVVASVHDRGFTVRVLQSFGNCPKYIQRRDMLEASSDAVPAPTSAEWLDGRATELVQAADTFFIASHVGTAEPSGGADISHRGGLPGFVRIDTHARTLTWPDYAGNNFFNTLGNLLVRPRAALVLPDFVNGDLLHVTGSAEIIWDGPEVASFAGAQRLVRLHVEEMLYRPHGLSLRWRLLEVSPMLRGT